jgi:hypothetical protein
MFRPGRLVRPGLLHFWRPGFTTMDALDRVHAYEQAAGAGRLRSDAARPRGSSTEISSYFFGVDANVPRSASSILEWVQAAH